MANLQERSDAGAKVTVACKLPAGLVMRGFVEGTERESVLGGGTREYKVYRPSGDEQQIMGTAAPFGQAPKAQIICGYALTPNVSKDLFDNWLAANKDTPLVKNKIIYAYESMDRVRGQAKECEAVKSGFEPIDPDNPGAKIRGIVKADKK